jgi:hypothetical protein
MISIKAGGIDGGFSFAAHYSAERCGAFGRLA